MTKSFRTKDLAELSNATPPITTSLVPIVGLVEAIDVDAAAEVNVVVLLKLKVEEDGTVDIRAEVVEEVAGVGVVVLVVS